MAIKGKNQLAILNAPIDALPGISNRALKWLHNGRIKTIGELIQKLPEELLYLKNFGTTCLKEVETALKSLSLRLSTHHKDQVNRRKRLHSLNIFDYELQNAFLLSNRARNALREAGINSLRDLMGMSSNDLLRLPGFGEKTVQEIQDCLNVLRVQLAKDSASPNHEENLEATFHGSGDSTPPEAETVDTPESTSEGQTVLPSIIEALDSLLSELPKRSKEMLEYCYLASKSRTLAETGKHFGVSRERARQIMSRTLERLSRSFLLKGMAGSRASLEELGGVYIRGTGEIDFFNVPKEKAESVEPLINAIADYGPKNQEVYYDSRLELLTFPQFSIQPES